MADPFHPSRMGLEPLHLADWLKPRAGDTALLAERARLIEAHRDNVIAALPKADAAVAELLTLLRGRGLAIDDANGTTQRLAVLGRGVAEDICVLTPEADGALCLTAGVLCFPNRWKLTEKLGGSILAVHGPVPDYAAQLSANVDRFLGRLKPERPFVRSNWGLTSVPDLFLPAPTPPVDPRKDTDFFLRREDQSFFKLAETGAVIFTIRTTVSPWREIPEDVRSETLKTIDGLGPAWLSYKSIAPQM